MDTAGSPGWHRRARQKRSRARDFIWKVKLGLKRSKASFRKAQNFAYFLSQHHSKPSYRLPVSWRHFGAQFAGSIGRVKKVPMSKRWNDQYGWYPNPRKQAYAESAWWGQGRKTNAKEKAKKDQDAGKLTAYDGSRLSLPRSSSSKPSQPQEEGDGDLRQSLMAHLAQHPDALPQSIKEKLIGEVDLSRQHLQKQLTAMKRLEQKIRKKKELLETKQVGWRTWSEAMRQMVLQESERYEKETQALMEEIDGLQRDLQTEQNKLSTMTPSGTNDSEMTFDQEEDSMEALLNMLKKGTKQAVPEPEGLNPAILIELQRQAQLQAEALANMTSPEKHTTPAAKDSAAILSDMLNKDPQWAFKNPTEFGNLLQEIVTKGGSKEKPNTMTPTTRTKRPAMEPFGGTQQAHKSPKLENPPQVPQEVALYTPEKSEDAENLDASPEKEEKQDLQTLS